MNASRLNKSVKRCWTSSRNGGRLPGWQYFTISYNLIEGLVSIWFGVQDEALTLFGFGVDSFIEVLSGIGILVMILRIRRNPDEPRTRFEQAALRVTGAAFYLLAAGLAGTAVLNLITGP